MNQLAELNLLKRNVETYCFSRAWDDAVMESQEPHHAALGYTDSFVKYPQIQQVRSRQAKIIYALGRISVNINILQSSYPL